MLCAEIIISKDVPDIPYNALFLIPSYSFLLRIAAAHGILPLHRT